jgi:aarF domain-containing kinase
MYLSPITLTNYIQGLDALGLATLDSVTSTARATIPFISLFSFPSMTDEDMVNLRTLNRLMQLLSSYQQTENSNLVRDFASPTLQ